MKILEHINWGDVVRLPKNELQRLLHGRGFCFPDYTYINIDWLAPVILIILYKEVEECWLHKLSEQLLAILNLDAFYAET